VLNNLDVTGVHVHERALLLVVGLPSGETGLQEGDGVRKLSSVVGGLNIEALSLGLVKLRVVTLGKLLLQIENLVLKGELVNLVLGLQGEDLIISILAEALAVVCRRVQLLNVLNSFVDLARVALVDARLVTQLLAPGVDVLAEGLVLRLQIVQLSGGLLASVLEELDLVLILSRLTS
jgi:hypothetical protein